MAEEEIRGKHAKQGVDDAAQTPSAEAVEPEGKAWSKTAGKVVAILVAVLVVAYAGVALYYQSHFLPRTTIGLHDVSDMTAEEAASALKDLEESYELSVSGAGLSFTISRDDAGLQLDSEEVAHQALDMNPAWQWPYYLAASLEQDLSEAVEATCDTARFEKLIRDEVAKVNKDASDPTSATIGYDEKVDGFAVVPEKLGTKLDEQAVVDKVATALARMDAEVEIGDDELLRPAILQDDERLAAAAEKANDFLGAEIDVRLDGRSYELVGSETIATWVVLDEDLKPSLSDDKLREWTNSLAQSMNTIGSKREYTTPRGDSYTVEGGTYGWAIDSEAFAAEFIEKVHAREKATIEVPCLSTALELPDKNGVDWGKRYVDVNLAAQHAVFYDDKDVIWETDVISGSPDGRHATPTGVYSINLKESPSKLVGEMIPVTVETVDKKGKKKTTTEMQPEYETVVQFWMPFIGNDIGFHDATWQPGFGGDMYAIGYGSHGCVNLPYDAAEQLYSLITEGTPVVVHQ